MSWRQVTVFEALIIHRRDRQHCMHLWNTAHMWAGRAAALSARLARPTFAALPVLSVRCAASKAAAVDFGRDRVSKVGTVGNAVLPPSPPLPPSRRLRHLFKAAAAVAWILCLQDVAEYWEQVLKTVDKATASKLINHLDVTQVQPSLGPLRPVQRPDLPPACCDAA